ncbi:MAG: BTAD domain-containing putative transcriptional regulator [Chloroflexota bacterium]
MSEYPVQFEKVQAPPLRDETLARARLLDWLSVKIHRRAVLVLAEAGYGKTTLLADFTRRTRVRVAWYRLDRGDRDWLGFFAHLVAALRVHQPDFGHVTQSMIRDASMGTSSRDMVLEAFIRELGTLSPEPASLVLDDFHLVDDSEDARAIVRAMLTRAPERMSFVLISRTTPSLPFARLRALGEVAELHTSDLRFAPEETEQLFRDTYALELDPGIVAELSRRTEGWVASLQLVRAAIRDRNQSEIRAFVRSLSGAEGNLYDYLAEEVVGELSAGLQQFLMRTSLLEVIEPVLAGVAARMPGEQTRASIADGEMLGLFSRIGPNTRDHVRAHPLVRDFLQARLNRSVGADAVIDIHRSVAAAAESRDWRIAGHHYLQAGDLDDARRVLAAAIESILATGAYSAAEELVTALPATDRPDPNVLVVLSRLAQQRGQSSLGRELAEAAFSEDRGSPPVALTVLSARLVTGDIEGAVSVASQLEAQDESAEAAALGQAIRLTLETSLNGDLEVAVNALESALRILRQRGGLHYIGVGLSNLGYLKKAQGDASIALAAADEAIELLEATSAGSELVSALLLRAWAVAHLGDLVRARSAIREAAETARGDQVLEVAYEGAEVEALYGDPDKSLTLLDGVDDVIEGGTDRGEQALLARIHAFIALGRFTDAQDAIAMLNYGARRSAVAFEARRHLAAASLAVLTSSPDAFEIARTSQSICERQGANLWAGVSRIIAASADREEFLPTIRREAARDIAAVSIAADVVAGHLDWFDQSTKDRVADEIRRREERWRAPLRRVATAHTGASQAEAAKMLDEVGTHDDVTLLRGLARASRGSIFPANAGRALARRLAPTVFVEDLGRVRLSIGGRTVDGGTMRRKVLALLCFLLTKPRFAAARDEVLEAMWPDLEPSTAQNSLNQTVYFLRRVFEPQFAEDTTPGYLGQDGETLWLDLELVQSRSRLCRELVRTMSNPAEPQMVMDLAVSYHGRFALDFLYEDWAAQYRDSLHAAYLRVLEGSLRADTDSGHYERGIELAQLAVEADPEAEELQMALTRLYRLSGSLAAASEQYQSYARSQRELGLEPEPMDRL